MLLANQSGLDLSWISSEVGKSSYWIQPIHARIKKVCGSTISSGVMLVSCLELKRLGRRPLSHGRRRMPLLTSKKDFVNVHPAFQLFNTGCDLIYVRSRQAKRKSLSATNAGNSGAKVVVIAVSSRCFRLIPTEGWKLVQVMRRTTDMQFHKMPIVPQLWCEAFYLTSVVVALVELVAML